MNFEEYLDELSNSAARLKIKDLERLSYLSEENAAALDARWEGIDARRRLQIVRELADLAEDNVELDFSGVFLRGLRDADPQVRLQSVRGLWENESPELIDRLVALLHGDEDPGVRAEAALALGRFVVLAEHGRLRSRHFQRVEAGLKAAIDNADEVAEVRGRALESIGAHDSPWVRQAVSEAYESGALRLKVSAIHAMGRSCEPRWLPLLTKELASEEAELRYEAAVAVGMVGEASSVPSLLPLLEDEDDQVREAALAALGEIGGPEAREALLKMLDSSSPATREAAAAALSEIDFEEDPLGFRFRT